MAEILLSLTQLVIVISFLFFLIRRLDREKEREQSSQEIVSQTMIKALESVKEMQINYFANISKQSKEQLAALDKQQKEFLKYLLAKDKRVEEKIITQKITPDLVENMIEKEEIEEIPLSESDRIPMVEGVKVKFEDDEQVYPIDITSVSNGLV